MGFVDKTLYPNVKEEGEFDIDKLYHTYSLIMSKKFGLKITITPVLKPESERMANRERT